MPIVSGDIIYRLSDSGATRSGECISNIGGVNQKIIEIWQRLGLDPDNALVHSDTAMTFAGINLAVTDDSMVARQ